MRISTLLACLTLLISGAVAQPAPPAPAECLLALSNGNWVGDDFTKGGMDAALPDADDHADKACLVVSADGALNFPPQLTIPVTLDKDFLAYPFVTFEIGYRASSMYTSQGHIWWDGRPVTTIDAQSSGDGLKVFTCVVEPQRFGLTRGGHQLKIAAGNTSNSTDLLLIDAIRIAPPGRLGFAGGRQSAPFEVLTLGNGNWEGDAASWGSADALSAQDPDRRGVWLKPAPATDDPAALELPVLLQSDFSRSPVRVAINSRWLNGAGGSGTIYWDDKPFAKSAAPAVIATKFTEQLLTLAPGQVDLSPGPHRLKFMLDITTGSNTASWQIDCLSFDQLLPTSHTLEFPLADCQWLAPALQPGPETEALRHLFAQIKALGGQEPVLSQAKGDPTAGARRTIHLGLSPCDPALQRHFAERKQWPRVAKLQDFQQAECYLLDLANTRRDSTLYLTAPASMGLVYGISELELRLRVRDGAVYLDLGEFAAEHPTPLLDAPELRLRGEYINIGYNIHQVTPHDWSRERWHDYIDRLVLARLNRFYFYLWVSDFSFYPDSADAKNPLNRKLHEDLRDAIDYCHQRGLKVSYMISPALIPSDVFRRHPEVRADIEYADWGYPAVCSNAPGAWELMRSVWRSEMQWFAKADALHIWYFDPGGCMCEKNGCKAHQAEVLERQTREFAALFREFNPQADIEYNLWPFEHFEQTRNIKFHQELSRRLTKVFGKDGITAVGSADSSKTLPLGERALGLNTSCFLFSTNPENAYAFLIPNLTLLERASREVKAEHLGGIFGHRLEAWTRYPATFFMGQYLWNPAAQRSQVVRKYADWQAADRSHGADLANILMLLDEFNQHGARPELGFHLSTLTQRVFPTLPALRQRQLEYFPAMIEALSVLGVAAGTQDNATLLELRERYLQSLAKSETFAPSLDSFSDNFLRYCSFLEVGWEKHAF